MHGHWSTTERARILVFTNRPVLRPAGTDRRPDTGARRFRRPVHDAHHQRAQTAVPHRPGVHPVRFRDIHPVRVPKEEAGDCRYVYITIIHLSYRLPDTIRDGCPNSVHMSRFSFLQNYGFAII